MKIVSRTIQNRYCFFDRLQLRFFIDFGSILGAIWEALGSHFGKKRAANPDPKAFRTVLVKIFAPRRVGDPIQDYFRTILQLPGITFGRIFNVWRVLSYCCCAVLRCVALCCVAQP